MNLINAILVGLKEIWAHKFRSLLTMMGIILGVSSLVGMSALVKGMENGMREALIAVGGIERVRIEAGDIPAWQQHMADQSVGITLNDVHALQKSSSLIRYSTPEMRVREALFTRGGKTYTPFVFMGTWPNALDLNQHEVEYGRMFNEIDDEIARAVCVVGTGLRDELFGSPDEVGYDYNPVGEHVNIRGQVFTIIGMFKRYESESERKEREKALAQPKPPATESGPVRSRGWGRRGGSGYIFNMKNNTVYIPLNTMWLRFRAASGTNNTPDPRLTSLTVKIKDIGQFEPAIEQVRNVLMGTHKGIEDFMPQTQENWSENIGEAIQSARISGGIIAAISLLVGGIGIMNIMLASITERIREIGIRKAIGATFTDVFIQILVESVVIAMIGGAAGLVCSMGLVNILATVTSSGNSPVVTLHSCVFAFASSVGVGILAGLFPAFKAARLDPIQALRYE
jgi:putative ABC transport system permease protein